MLRGSGFYPKAKTVDILLLSFFIIIFSSSKKIFWFILFPFVLIYAIYTPIGLNFGGPSYQHIASLIATDLSEGKEFLMQIGVKSYLYALSIPLLLILFRIITTKFSIHLYRNKLILSCATIYLLLDSAPIKIFKSTYTASIAVKKELDKLNSLAIKSEWGKATLTENSKYDNYILIIGESARRDYHHAYGYPIENTPFMSKANGMLIDGMTSAGTYTIGSLKLMLTKPDKKNWKENYALNIIDLINLSGINTYWISNQGYLGIYDTPISSIAKKSNIKFFQKKGDSSIDRDDFELLPILRKYLSNRTNKSFFTLHLYGSHPNACDRIKNTPKIFNSNEIEPKYSYINCYISSIRKTDNFIEQVYKILKENQQETNQSFSIIYFSDHVQCHNTKQNKIIFDQGCHSRLHNNIPLFKISSDDTERKVYKVFKSGLNFTDGIANWIGIKNEKIDSTINLFSPIEDEDYGLQEKINDKRRLKEPDPAIDIRKLN